MLILTLSCKATLQSWAIKYVDNASNLLYNHLVSHPKDETHYARYISIIQLLGTGKSCMVNELAKTHLVVPLTLHQKSNGKYFCTSLVQAPTLKGGFLAADEKVHNWFLQSKTKLEVFMHAGTFLCMLFVTVDDYWQNIDNKIVNIALPPPRASA